MNYLKTVVELRKLLRSSIINERRAYKRYLKDIYRELAEPDGISLINFQEFYGIPFNISKRIFYMFRSDDRFHKLKFQDFEDAFLSLFSNRDKKSFIHLIFMFLDLDDEMELSYGNVYRILWTIVSSLNSTKSQEESLIDPAIVEKILTDGLFSDCNSRIAFPEFVEKTQCGFSDLFFIITFYLFLTQPFSSKILSCYKADPRVNGFAENLSIQTDSHSYDNIQVTYPNKYFGLFFNNGLCEFLQSFIVQPIFTEESTIAQQFSIDDIDEDISEKQFLLPLTFEFKNKFSPISSQLMTSPGLGSLSFNTDNMKNLSKSVSKLSKITLEKELRDIPQLNLGLGDSTLEEKNTITIFENKNLNEEKEYSYQPSTAYFEASDGHKSLSNEQNHLSGTVDTIPAKSFFLDANRNPNLLNYYENYFYKHKHDGNFKKYWIVLVDKMMFYFKNEKKTKLRGVRYLTENSLSAASFTCLNQNIQTSHGKISFSMKLSNKIRNYYCDSLSDVQKWRDMLFTILNIKIFSEHYTCLDFLKNGNRAVLIKAEMKDSGERVAIKVFSKEKYQKGTEQYDYLKNEIEITKMCRHPNIIRFIDTFHDYGNYYLVMEYIPLGDFHQIFNGVMPYTSDVIKKIITGLCQGIRYLHSIGIIHRDIKTENICLKKNITPVIIDFGYSKFISEKELCNESCGTIFFIAPEIMQQIPYGIKADIWSLGITMYYIIAGKLPFYNKHDISVCAKRLLNEKIIFNDKFKAYEQLQDLIEKCVNKNYSTRYSIEQVLSHVYLFSVE